ncbi:MAG: helix-turn-helix domain-containing protein [Pseudomonadales bacterium]|nr:helix-turn-helix domain-containing protein [Pseudomonadales bacterium]
MTQNSLQSQYYSIAEFDHFTHSVCETFCQMDVSINRNKQGDVFSGELYKTTLDKMKLARIASNSLTVYRRKQDIAGITDPFYLVKFQLKGESTLQQCGREAHLKPGDFALCSTTEPYQLHLPSAYQQAVLAIPQATLHELLKSPDDYLGIRMGSEFPTHGLLSQFLFSLIQRIELLSPAVVKRLEANILDLLITSLEAMSNADISPQESAVQDHLRRIKRFIAMHLQDSRLSPEFIAQAEGISKRYLHMLFKEEGISVSRYIQQQRLEACSRTLASSAMQHLSTTDIALEWGFGDLSHFHRCFKAHYQITPRQYRLRANNDDLERE